ESGVFHVFPSFEARLSKLGCGNRSERPRQRYMVERCHFEKSEIPSSHQREGGGGVTKKMARSLLLTPPGWCSLSHRSEHHPVLAKADAARYFLDRSATPYSA